MTETEDILKIYGSLRTHKNNFENIYYSARKEILTKERKDWYVVSFNYKTDYLYANLNEINNWCNTNLSDSWIRFDFYTWQFKSKNDAILFKLTWY